MYFPVPGAPQGTGIFLFAPSATKDATRQIVGAAFLTQPIPSLQGLTESGRPPVNTFNNAAAPGMTATMKLSGMGAQAVQLNLMQQKLQQNNQRLLGQSSQQQPPQPGQPSFNPMAGMGGMGAIGVPQMTPQAQAQNRLLAGGFNTMGGVFDNANGPGGGAGAMPIGGMGSAAFAQQMNSLQAMPNFGGLNFNGPPGGNPMNAIPMGANPAAMLNNIGSMPGGLTMDMLRALQQQHHQQQQQGQGPPGGLGGA